MRGVQQYQYGPQQYQYEVEIFVYILACLHHISAAVSPSTIASDPCKSDAPHGLDF